MNFNTVYNRSFQKLAGRYNMQSTSEASMNKSAMEKKANVLLGILALALDERATTDYMKRNLGTTKSASYRQFKEAATAAPAAFAAPQAVPDALTPFKYKPAEDPKKAVGDAQMAQAAAAEGVGANTPQQPISDQDIAAKAIETVDKGNQALLKYLTQSKKNDQAAQQTYQQPANPVV